MIMDKKELIQEKHKQLVRIYSTEASKESTKGLWFHGYKDGHVSEELYEEARKYYGDTWGYPATV